MLWTLWWVWAAAALVLGILEILIPGTILLGFAIGAGVVAILFAFGVPLTLPVTLVVFAVASLIAWIIVRRIVGVNRTQVKVWDTDIND
ncbi:NfeD family protein [Cochlodiniinecator piscidefendens]|uniref:NfeD family protein n=1 Tax=Cochlodiniinecator piscidefendens TaxID=2715756 RepID=UPI0014074827|nr:hypothetical protein [Cochlodiniinecator piscidefendens]